MRKAYLFGFVKRGKNSKNGWRNKRSTTMSEDIEPLDVVWYLREMRNECVASGHDEKAAVFHAAAGELDELLVGESNE